MLNGPVVVSHQKTCAMCFFFVDEIALNKKRGRAQSVEPVPLQEIDSEVRCTVVSIHGTKD